MIVYTEVFWSPSNKWINNISKIKTHSVKNIHHRDFTLKIWSIIYYLLYNYHGNVNSCAIVSSQAKSASGYPNGYDEVLDNVFPPEEWEENGKTWRRVASTNPANRQDVFDLLKELTSQLKYWRAKTQGLCRIRRELYTQFFSSSL